MVMMPRQVRLFLLVTAILLFMSVSVVQAAAADSSVADTLGPHFQPDAGHAIPDLRRRPRPPFDPANWVKHWNDIAVDASGLDHTPVTAGEQRVFGEQFGPGRGGPAMGIVHMSVL